MDEKNGSKIEEREREMLCERVQKEHSYHGITLVTFSLSLPHVTLLFNFILLQSFHSLRLNTVREEIVEVSTTVQEENTSHHYFTTVNELNIFNHC